MGGGVARCLAVNALSLGGVGIESETLETAHEVLLDFDAAVGADLGVKFFLFLQAAHQRAGAPVDKTLGQALVHGVGERVFDRARAFLPALGIGQPVGAVRHERPGADVGDAVGERVDVAVGAVGERDLVGKPVLGNAPLGPHQELVERTDELGVVLRGDLAVVGDLAHFPQPGDGVARGGEVRYLAVVADCLERGDVIGHARTREAKFVRHLAQALAQPVEGAEVEIAAAPLQRLHGIEGVRLEALDQLGLERLDAAGDAESAVVHVPAGAARDLGKFAWG